MPRRLLIALPVMVVGLICVPNAFAECGPGFSSKTELIRIVKHNPSIAHGMRKELLAEPKSEYNADETVLNYIRESSQKVFKAPPGYKLKTNTYCPGGYGDYHPYGGLLENMPGKPLLWHCNKSGECVPILKGYCMNYVTGRAVHKHHPKNHKCGCKKPKKPRKKKPAPECSTKSPNGGGGNCVQQVVTVQPQQGCGAENHSSAGGCVQNTTTIVNNCGNVNTGTGEINQGGNCNSGGTETCVGQGNCTTHEEETCVDKSCNVTPPPEEPCGCKPPEEPPSILITSMTTLNMVAAEKDSGPFKINVEASKAGGSLTVDPGIGTVSLCDGTAPQEKVVFTNLAADASEQCVILYAPEHDADMPTEMKVIVTAVLGSAHDQKEQTFKITYPTRPPE